MAESEARPSVLWVSSEAAPYASTGGLAEVAGAMPRALHAAGWPVALMMPCYTERCSTSAAPRILSAEPLAVEIAGRVFDTEIVHAVGPDGVPLRLLRYDPFFARTGIYAQGSHDYPDNHLRFALLSKAACEVVKREGFEIAHLNDWPTALVAIFLATHYRNDPALARVRVLQSIHNLAHPGCFETHTLEELGLARELAVWDLMGHHDEFSWLKGGLLLADALHTVSPRYSREILEPAGGLGLEGLLRLRQDRLHGVLNGIDYDEWNPEETHYLLAPFSKEDLSGKGEGKQFLQETFHLKKRARTPLLAFLGRMAPQKGLDLLLEIAPRLIGQGAQLVIVGSGQPELEQRCRELSRQFPGEVGVHIGFERSLAHQVTSGADMVVMPSVFEPCGLTQLQAMRYGTIPVVHAVGGLADTVTNTTASTVSSKSATGFVFRRLTTRALSMCLGRALKHYANRRGWTQLMRNAMAQDFSWQSVLPGYEAMYRELFDHEPWRFGFELPTPAEPAPAEPTPFLDWGPTLPDRYHQDTLRLMVQSPTQLYVYWELAREHDGVVRLEIDRERDSWIERPGIADVGDAWLPAEPDCLYRVRLVGADGQELLRSNVVRTPRVQPSDRQAERWLEAEERRTRHLAARLRRAREGGEPIPGWAFEDATGPDAARRHAPPSGRPLGGER